MSPAGGRSVLALTLAILLVLGGLTAGTAATTADEPGVPTRVVDAPTAQVGGVNETNGTNTSLVQQRDPRTIDEAGNHEAVRAWLRGRMATLLANSTIRLSQGEYEAANRTLGGEYDSSLEKYVDVAGSTERDTEVGETFAETRAQQREYVTTRERYDETYRAYQETRERGNETRARQLARTLSDLNARLEERGASLTAEYVTLGNRTGIPVENETQRINDTTAGVANRTNAVVEASFTRTTLNVETNASSASFDRPLGVRGHVQTINGTPISGPATIVIGNRRTNVTLDANGTFARAYRPISVPTGTNPLRVAYRPLVDAAYLGNETTTPPVTIDRRTPSLSVATTSQVAQFGRELVINGSVMVNETPVPDVPVDVTLAGVHLGTATTDVSGQYQTRVRVPATVPNGTVTVRATTALRERAIGEANATSTVRVTTTPTELSIDGTWQGGAVVVTGRLTTRDGTEIGSRQVTLRENETVLTTIRTSEDGTYRVRLRPEMLPDQTKVSLVAVHDEMGTSLAGSRASVTLQRPGSTRSSSLPLVPIAGLGAIVLMAAGGGGLYWRSRRQRRAERSEAEGAGSSATSTETSATADEGAQKRVREALTRAEDMADEEPERAVETAYAAVRAALDTGRRAQTHWEFVGYVNEARALPEAEHDDLQSLTAAYEKASFSRVGVSRERAVDAVDAAARLLDHAEQRDE